MSHTQPKHEIKEIKEMPITLLSCVSKPNIRKMALLMALALKKRTQMIYTIILYHTYFFEMENEKK